MCNASWLLSKYDDDDDDNDDDDDVDNLLAINEHSLEWIFICSRRCGKYFINQQMVARTCDLQEDSVPQSDGSIKWISIPSLTLSVCLSLSFSCISISSSATPTSSHNKFARFYAHKLPCLQPSDSAIIESLSPSVYSLLSAVFSHCLQSRLHRECVATSDTNG